MIFSDDGGTTWQAGDIAIPGGGECQAAELNNGKVILSARNSAPQDRRAVAYSDDSVTGWFETMFVSELHEPGCMAALVSHPGAADVLGPLLLFSNPHTTERPHRDRRNLTVQLSRDHGRTWPVKRLLQGGPSAYSDLAVLSDGTVPCLCRKRSSAGPLSWESSYGTALAIVVTYQVSRCLGRSEDVWGAV